MKLKQEKKTGFLLFEALIAILIASTALVAIVQGVSSSLKIGNRAQKYFKAVILTESKIALIEKESACKEEVFSGKFDKDIDPEGVYSWRQEIKPVTTYKWGMAKELPVSEARVSVMWEGNQVELVTYVTKYKESAYER